MLKDKRKHKRFDVETTLKSRICRKDKRTLLSGDIPVSTKDISLGGMRLEWPKRWECKKCNKCLGWVFNHNCRFKNNETNRINRLLDDEVLLKVTVEGSRDKIKDIFLKVVWTKKTEDVHEHYDVGLNFVNTDRDIEETINIIVKENKKK
jgi:hypothetical protein